ncbi:MAG: protein phosphatase CheZ [Rhodospirillales bacterium]|nr:protein phosphatase CheZ [Rhodospirillales bacterium]
MSQGIFTAELMQQRKQSPENPDPLADRTAESRAAARHKQVLTAVARLQRRLDALSRETAASHAGCFHIGAAAPVQSVPQTAAATDDQLDGLRAEVRELSQSIIETKRQIAALRNGNRSPDRLICANDELDAVVHATEGATEIILTAAEEIDAIAARLRSSVELAGEVAALEEISDRTIRIFEACNFQDITGQRISKVVNTMKFVESRVERMIEIFGGPDSFAGVEPPEDAPAPADSDADMHLLHGPQLATDRPISQEDIDKLFD